jgi:hypothetical protein
MEKKIISFVLIGIFNFLTFQISYCQVAIKLIGYTSNGQTIDNVVKWNAGQTNFSETIPVDYVGVLSGSSVYNSNSGEYYSRVLVNENEEYLSKMFKYNSLNNSIELNEVTSVYNGSAEVDMQNGLLYSYDSDLDNNVYLNRFNPYTQISTNLGYFNLNDIGILFPDGSCFDSDNHVYYFITQVDGEKKMIKSTITDNGYSFTITPLIGPNIIGNIGLEYSNEQNKIHLIYPEYNDDTGTSTLNIGEVNTETGEISNLVNISEVIGLQLFNRTYDQNTETLVFIAIDLDNQQRLYTYNTITNQLNSQPLPQSVIIEIEADNFEFAQARFGQLGITENYLNPFTIYPNPTQDSFKLNFEGTDTEYELFDLLGKSVQNGFIQNGKETDVSNLNKGIYVLELKSKSFNIKKKLVVQ